MPPPVRENHFLVPVVAIEVGLVPVAAVVSAVSVPVVPILKTDTEPEDLFDA